MGAFYGAVQGNRGEATRMGSKKSGIHGYVQSWAHRIESHLKTNEDETTDHVNISISKQEPDDEKDAEISIYIDKNIENDSIIINGQRIPWKKLKHMDFDFYMTDVLFGREEK